MSYSAKVFKVMIASPSDVSVERGIVRETLGEWNVIHSERAGAVLLPVGWETHSSPEMGASPQSIINRTVLDGCDLLVGIFWTRVGTSTEDHLSGTVEEIETHIAAEKPTMLYFSAAPVVPDSVDPEQYRRLKNFKETCKSRGLLESYSDLQDFRSKFFRHIQLKMNQDEYFAGTSGGLNTINPPVISTSIVRLSPEAEELLRSASSANGRILRVRFLSGEHIQAGQKEFIEEDSPRSAATWRAALQELERQGFIQGVGWKGELWEVTREGYSFYDFYLKPR